MADEQKTLIDITALKYFYKSLQNVTVLIAPSSIESASSQNLGRTYFIPADGTYAGLSCKKGDHIVSNGTAWVLIPKGTSEGGKEYYAGTGIDISKVDDKDTITNTGVTAIAEATGDANKGKINVTTNGKSANVAVHGLGSAAYETVGTEKTDITSTGTKVPNAKAVYGYVDDAIKALDVTDSAVTGKYVSAVSEADGKITVTRASLPTAKNTYDAESEEAISGKGVKDAIDGIPSPMIFKAVANSVSDLETPVASGADKNVGWTYKVGTAFKYGDIDCKTGDILICDGTKYEYVPSANEDNIIETIKVEGEPLTVGTDKSVNITRSNLGLSNVTNDKQIKGLASGTTTEHIVVFGADGYTVKDSGKTIASAISGKEDSANRATDWNTTPVHTKYPSEKLVKDSLDKKANKTFIEAVDNTTSVVTVPEGTSFAAVGKICGKTVKDGEVLKSAPVKSVVSWGRNLVDKDKMESGYYDVTGKAATTIGFMSSGMIPVKSGKQYFCSMYTNDGTRIDRCVITTYINATDIKAQAQITNQDSLIVPTGINFIRVRNISDYSSYVNSGNYVYVVTESTSYSFVPYNKTTVSIPQEILDLPDYGCSAGDVYNWVDFENMVYHHKVGSIDLGSLTWESQNNGGKIRGKAMTSLPAIVSDGSLTGNIICSSMDSIGSSATYDGTANGIGMPLDAGTGSAFYMYPYKTSVELKGVIANFELRTEEVIDISSILYPFPVESGGTITFENEHNLDINNKVIYQKGMV